jgi:hypothetical protein
LLDRARFIRTFTVAVKPTATPDADTFDGANL